MKILALLLLILGLSKLCLVTISNNMEVKELIYRVPILVNAPPDAMKALLVIDGLLSTFGGVALFYL